MLSGGLCKAYSTSYFIILGFIFTSMIEIKIFETKFLAKKYFVFKGRFQIFVLL